TAVFEELTRWQDTFDLRLFFSPTRQFSIFSQLSSLDSISRSGDSLVKIYHLENSWDTLSSMNHSDSLAFHANADTFCDVRFEDFCLHTISVIEGDTIWVVKYRKNPPDTLWRLASAGKKIYPQGQFGKVYAWSGPRKIQLKKQADSYQLKRFGGLTIYVPARESAPKIQYVVLAKSSVSDTFYESDVSNNLISLDSLFIVEVGESLLVSVKSEDSDTEGNPYYFFIQSGSDKLNITYDARFGRGKIVFGQSGINHINIEVLPGKNLFYPSNNYYSTIWSIPIRVR
ncbi:MAG: hypothetical protein OEW70_00445, partial [candidate division WOR-3 bacterium]|nr:hypothetical protein [candidate division WOR-3 bacterium]